MTDAVLEDVTAWQNRPLEPVYAIVYFDALRVKVRGTQDLLVAVVDGLKGFPEAITSVFPDCVVQTCIVHLIRYSLQFASWKEQKPLARALKVIYAAATAEAAAAELDRFEAGPYGERYAAVVHSWRRRWEQVCGESGVAHACSSPSIATSKTGITAVS